MGRIRTLFQPAATRRLVLGLLLAAFALRGVTPDGYMFETSPDGAVKIELCGGQGPTVLKWDLKDGKPAQGGNASCPYALTAILLLPAPLAPPEPPVFARLERAVLPLEARHRPASVVAPFPPRGPPAAA